MKKQMLRKLAAASGAALILLTAAGCSQRSETQLQALEIQAPATEVTQAANIPAEESLPESPVPSAAPEAAAPSSVQTDTEPAAQEDTEPAAQEAIIPVTEPQVPSETPSVPAREPDTASGPEDTAQELSQTATSNKAQQSTSSDTSDYTGDPYFEDFSSMPGWDDLLWPGDEGYEEAKKDEDRLANLSANTGKPELPFAVTLSQRTLEVGQEWGVAFTYPGDPYTLTWESSDPTVATVNYVGYVTPLAEGETLVSVTDGCTTLTCRIIVIPATPQPPKLTDAEKDAAAREVAKKIAEQILSDGSAQTDLDRVRMATKAVFRYAMDGFTSSYHEDCRTAYGPLVAGYSNCVGTTKALGLVLEYMGYSWSHVNQNEWTHQWCEVYGVDGQTAYADASYNKSGYGQRPEVEDGIFYVEGSLE